MKNPVDIVLAIIGLLILAFGITVCIYLGLMKLVYGLIDFFI